MDSGTGERLYTIQHDGWHYHAGRIRSGTQVLMGVQLPELVMVEFDDEGGFLRTLQRALSRAAVSDEDQRARELERWQEELGFTPGAISVHRYFLPERWIGIRDLPDHYQEVLDRPEALTEERRRELEEDIRLWRERGDFVLYWDEDYYLDRDGELQSS
jgi:hypothetical protein